MALLFATPLIYLVVRSVTEGSDVWGVIASRAALVPLLRTIGLGLSVAIAASAIGTSLAWFVGRTDLPGRRWVKLLLPLPLVFPSFVGAFVMLAAFAPGGIVARWGLSVGVIDGFVGAFAVLTLFTFPYVYLPVLARLRSLPPALEESARLLGVRPRRSFWTVVLPQIADAMVGGSLLVFLYTISDFGVVQLMRFGTLTRSIYAARLLDRSTSIALSLLLAILALGAVTSERWSARALRRVPGKPAARRFDVKLGRAKPLAVSFVGGILLLSLVVPVGVLVWWVARASSGRGAGMFAELRGLAAPAFNTASVSLLAATVAAVVVLPVAYASMRRRSRLGAASNAIVLTGFALPGVVLALALVFWTLGGPGFLGILYQSLPLLVLAYVIHFGAHSLRTTRTALAGLPDRIDDAARTLGARRWQRLIEVELPLIAPGALAGAGLVLLSTMKELPATLLLAPAGFQTLAIKVWQATESAFFGQASLAALALVLVSGVLTWWLVIRHAEERL